jgi:hypothetical protein
VNSILELQYGNLLDTLRGKLDLSGAFPGYFDRNADHYEIQIGIVELATKCELYHVGNEERVNGKCSFCLFITNDYRLTGPTHYAVR